MNKRFEHILIVSLTTLILTGLLQSCTNELMGKLEDKVYYDENGFYPFKNKVYKQGTLFHDDDPRNFAAASFSDNSVLLVYQDYNSGPNNTGRVVIGADGTIRSARTIFSHAVQCYSQGAGELKDGRAAGIYHNNVDYYLTVFQSDGSVDIQFPLLTSTFHEGGESRPVLHHLPDGDLLFIGMEDTPRGSIAVRISTESWSATDSFMVETDPNVGDNKSSTLMADGRVLVAYQLSDSSPHYRIIDPDDDSVSSAVSLNTSVDDAVYAAVRLADDRILLVIENSFQVWSADMSSRILTRDFESGQTMNASAVPTLDGGAVIVYRDWDDSSRPKYVHINSSFKVSTPVTLHNEDSYYTAASLRPDGKVVITYGYNTSGDHRGYYLILE